MISSFFKTRKAKQFNFSARFYDENKEELKERYDRIQSEMKGEAGGRISGRKDFKSQWVQRKKTSHFESKSNVRLVFIFILLSAICYFILYY